MPWWTVAWLVWGLIFLAIEGRALINKTSGDTLSEHIWLWFRVKDSRPTGFVIAARVVLAAFLTWLLLHMTLGWFTLSDPVPW